MLCLVRVKSSKQKFKGLKQPLLAAFIGKPDDFWKFIGNSAEITSKGLLILKVDTQAKTWIKAQMKN